MKEYSISSAKLDEIIFHNNCSVMFIGHFSSLRSARWKGSIRIAPRTG